MIRVGVMIGTMAISGIVYGQSDVVWEEITIPPGTDSADAQTPQRSRNTALSDHAASRDGGSASELKKPPTESESPPLTPSQVVIPDEFVKDGSRDQLPPLNKPGQRATQPRGVTRPVNKPVRQSRRARNPLYVNRRSDGTLVTSHSPSMTATGPSGSSAGQSSAGHNHALPLLDSPLTASNTVHNSGRVAHPSARLTNVRPRTIDDYDPFKVVLQWDWERMSVGAAVQIVAGFVGYNLIVRDDMVRRAYTMPLPGTHRRVSGVDSRTALEILGGPAFTLVVDHAARTIQHVSKPHYTSPRAETLEVCPSDVDFALQAGNTWIIDGGIKCRLPQSDQPMVNTSQ